MSFSDHVFFKVVCYYTNWSQYRTKIGRFTPEDISPDLCTHIIFAFAWMKKGKITSFESNDETKDGTIGLYERIMKLKLANPKLKILLAIGKLQSKKKKNNQKRGCTTFPIVHFRIGVVFFYIKYHYSNTCRNVGISLID